MNIPKSIDECIKQTLGNIKITSEAFEKANYVSRRISELAGEKLELYFYLTNFHEKQEKGDIAVRDIFIAHKQKVYPNLVETHDTVTSQNIIINSLDQDIIGWGHSHGNHSNFHSDIDNESTNGTLAIHGIEYQFDFENNQDMPHLNRGRDKIYYTFSMVFNARNETPYCVLAYSLERFKSGKLIKEVPFEIIEEKNNIPFEKVDIDKQLLERVIIRGEESLLDIYSKKTGRFTEDTLRNVGNLEPIGSYGEKNNISLDKAEIGIGVVRRMENLDLKVKDIRPQTVQKQDYPVQLRINEEESYESLRYEEYKIKLAINRLNSISWKRLSFQLNESDIEFINEEVLKTPMYEQRRGYIGKKMIDPSNLSQSMILISLDRLYTKLLSAISGLYHPKQSG